MPDEGITQHSTLSECGVANPGTVLRKNGNIVHEHPLPYVDPIEAPDLDGVTVVTTVPVLVAEPSCV